MIVFVNATAARAGGALTILRQFLDNIAVYNSVGNKYYVFISPSVALGQFDDVEFVRIDTKSYFRRIVWDCFGLRRWSRKNNIKPGKVISLQNTGVNFGSVPQLIYFHQLLPIESYKWNPFLRDQLPLFLYKNIYTYFIRKNLYSYTKVVVQLDWIKEAFAKKFHFNVDDIYVIRPEVRAIDTDCIKKEPLDVNQTHFFFPATPLIYKNHMDIVLAVKKLKEQNKVTGLKIHFTCEDDSSYKFVRVIAENGLREYFEFHGVIPYERVLRFYKSVDALLFPSYIETFGLPLVESALFGLPVLCNELPYTRDVIAGYQGVRFLPLHDIESWANEMYNILRDKCRFSSIVYESNTGWKDFFELINQQ